MSVVNKCQSLISFIAVFFVGWSWVRFNWCQEKHYFKTAAYSSVLLNCEKLNGVASSMMIISCINDVVNILIKTVKETKLESSTALSDQGGGPLYLGLYSLSGKTSYRKIPWSLKAARFRFKLFQSLWNWAGTPAAACQFSERYDHCNIQSRGFETSRDLAVRRLTA